MAVLDHAFDDLGVIGLPSSAAAVAIKASIGARAPRGRRNSRSKVRRRDSDPLCSRWLRSGWPSLAGGSVSLINKGARVPIVT
jgi:hypothetical protein